MNHSVHYSYHSSVELFEGTLTGHVFPWHFHSCYTIVIVEAGAMEYEFRDDSLTVNAGQIAIINPYEPHFNKPKGFCSYKVIFLPIAKINGSNGRDLVYFDKVCCRSLSLTQESLHVLTRLKDDTYLHTEHLIQQLAAYLLTHLPSSLHTIGYDERILPAMEFVKANIQNKITVDALAGACRLSKFHFQRVFSSSVGLTANAYVQQQRIELSKKLIRQGSKIVTAALDTGYYDQSHFHKRFSKMYGVTPARFGQ